MSLDDHDAEQCGGNAAPYVLGALTDEEHMSFRRHLESCAVCREEVAALEVVASTLPSAAPQMSAPPELKRRMMVSVRADERAREREASVPGARRGLRSAPRPAGGGWLRWRPNIAVAVLASALIALTVVALASGGSRTRVIRAQVSVPHASASLSVAGGRAQLEVADMPQAGRGRVYEVWRKGAGAPQPTDALFNVSSNGDATVSVPGGVANVREVLVTSEPEGGSRAPTNPPVIVARVS